MSFSSRRTPVILGILAVGVLVASCGTEGGTPSNALATSTSASTATPSEGPVAVVHAYFAAEDDQDCDGMSQRVTETYRADRLLCEVDEIAAFECPSGFVGAGETEIDGEFAMVAITEVYGCMSGQASGINPADYESAEVNLVIEDGEWRINEISSPE